MPRPEQTPEQWLDGLEQVAEGSKKEAIALLIELIQTERVEILLSSIINAATARACVKIAKPAIEKTNRLTQENNANKS